MKHVMVSFGLILILVIGCKKEKEAPTKLQTAVIENTIQDGEEIYQFQVTDLYGDDFDFSKLKGKKIMVVLFRSSGSVSSAPSQSCFAGVCIGCPGCFSTRQPL